MAEARVLYCHLCGQRFETKNPRVFCKTMDRHRGDAHPDHQGPIHYNRTPPHVQGTLQEECSTAG